MTDEIEVPHVEDAPGLRWRRRNDKWECFWRARADIVKKGFTPKNRFLWRGLTLSNDQAEMIGSTCRRHQAEMIVFGHGGLPKAGKFSGTMASLIDCYQTDRNSTYRKLRYHVRVRTDYALRKIAKLYGQEDLETVSLRTILAWHTEWRGGANGDKIAAAHALIKQLRTLFSFGDTLLEDKACGRLSHALSKRKFEMSRPRIERMTAEQATAIRHAAHAAGRPSIALAQAFQFECLLRQKDVIGEWVPLNEPGTSDVVNHLRGKWLHGLRWNEIDQNLILRHVTSKRGKELIFDLRDAPMVMEELQLLAEREPGPKSGPVIVAEKTGVPWKAQDFRLKWREIATAAGCPKSLRSMDSRAGGITEATDAGADLEHVRHAATHSNISMTQRYSRGGEDKTAKVMRIRAEHRNKDKTR